MNREEAIKELKEYEDGLDLEYATPFDKAILQAIKALEQEPKTGHWKHNKCDVCGASRPPLFDNFCPNCGAKMEEQCNT